jgi:hypothetical protein
MPTKLDQARLIGMNLKIECLESSAQLVRKRFGFRLMFEPRDPVPRASSTARGRWSVP